jgi:hypothetical protein
MLRVEVAGMAPTNAQTPDEKFADELRRYLKFEGGLGEISDPLGWWRVCSYCIVMKAS